MAELDVFCIDDSVQAKPTRKGMKKLVGVGGVRVPGERARDLERDLKDLSIRAGFPAGPSGEFKWSPGKELWMRKNLTDTARTEFYANVLTRAQDAGCTAIVVIEDTKASRATDAKTAEEDVVRLFLERAHSALGSYPQRDGLVIADRPSTKLEEAKFLDACLLTLQQGTDYALPDRIAFNVIATSSHLIRLLQLADLVVSCTTAFVSGESKWSPATFGSILPMLRTELDRKGGVGLKLHPDFRYMNLYHWLLGDEHFVRWPSGIQLPAPGRPYAESADRP